MELRIRTRLAVALLWLGLAPVTAFAQAQTPAVATPPQDAAVTPIECWWKTDRSAVRIGEQFSLTLTCAVVDTERVKVVVDESSRAGVSSPGAVRDRWRPAVPRHPEQPAAVLPVSARHACARQEFFGKEITPARLQLSYRAELR